VLSGADSSHPGEDWALDTVCIDILRAWQSWLGNPILSSRGSSPIGCLPVAWPILGCGIVWVLAEMHRDPIISRITHSKANELGIEFYVPSSAFDAVPVFTWIAYQFPGIGNSIFKFLRTGLEVVE
jgi:hypothetical protein